MLRHLALCFATLSTLLASAADDKSLFKYNGKSYSMEDMTPAVRQAFYDADHLRYENYKRIIDTFILEQNIKDRVKKTGKTMQAVEAEVFKLKEFSEKDAQAWYDKNKEALGGRDFASLKKEIVYYLKNEEQEKVKERVVEEIKKSGGFSLLVSAPKAELVQIAYQGYPNNGVKNPKATLVIFADYLCGHCKKASEVVKKIVDQNKDKIQLFYLFYPLSQTGASHIIAQGAVCAEKQNKFWEYHYMAYDNQMKLTDKSPGEFAKALKLNVDAFNSCLNLETTKKMVEKSRAEGERIGVAATPAIYINGVRHNGYSEESLMGELKKYF